MAGISTVIKLRDDMSHVVKNINNNLEKCISTMKRMGNTPIANGLKTAGKVTGAATAAVVAGATVAGKKLVEMAGQTAELGDSIKDMSQKIGVSTQAYQEWDYVFKQNGASVDGLRAGMKKLSSVIVDAGNGGKTAQEQLAAVGLSVKDLAGKSQDEQLSTVITALQGMGSGAERTSAATDLLGKSAVELGAVLNMTAEDTEALKQEARDFGMVMSDDAIAAADNYQDTLQKLQGTVSGVRNRLMGELLPGMTSVMDGFANLVAGNEGAGEAIESGFGQVISSVTAMLPKAISIIESVASAILTAAPTIIESLVDGLLGAIDSLAPVASQVVVKLVSSIAKMLPKIYSTGIKLIVTLANSLSSQLPTLIPIAVEAIVQIVTGLVDNLPMILDAALQLILGLADGLLAALPTLIAALPAIINGIVDFLIGAIPMIISAGVDLLGSLIDNSGAIITAIVSALPEIIFGLCNGIISHLGEIITAGVKLFIGLHTALPMVAAQIIASIPQMVANWIQSFLNFVRGFYDVGKQFLTGLWNGIKDTVGWVIDRIKGIGGRIMDGVKAVFGIHSPSKEMAWVGEMMGKGLAEGITSSTHYAEDATRAMSSDIMSAAGDMNATAKIGAEYTGMTASSFTAGGKQSGAVVNVNVDMTLNNSISSKQDVDDIVTQIAVGLRSKLSTSLQGVL